MEQSGIRTEKGGDLDVTYLLKFILSFCLNVALRTPLLSQLMVGHGASISQAMSAGAVDNSYKDHVHSRHNEH